VRLAYEVGRPAAARQVGWYDGTTDRRQAIGTASRPAGAGGSPSALNKIAARSSTAGKGGTSGAAWGGDGAAQPLGGEWRTGGPRAGADPLWAIYAIHVFRTSSRTPGLLKTGSGRRELGAARRHPRMANCWSAAGRDDRQAGLQQRSGPAQLRGAARPTTGGEPLAATAARTGESLGLRRRETKWGGQLESCGPFCRSTAAPGRLSAELGGGPRPGPQLQAQLQSRNGSNQNPGWGRQNAGGPRELL